MIATIVSSDHSSTVRISLNTISSPGRLFARYSRRSLRFDIKLSKFLVEFTTCFVLAVADSAAEVVSGIRFRVFFLQALRNCCNNANTSQFCIDKLQFPKFLKVLNDSWAKRQFSVCIHYHFRNFVRFHSCILTNRRVRNFLIVPTTSSVATPLHPSNAKRSRDLSFRPLPLPFFGFRLVSSL